MSICDACESLHPREGGSDIIKVWRVLSLVSEQSESQKSRFLEPRLSRRSGNPCPCSPQHEHCHTSALRLLFLDLVSPLSFAPPSKSYSGNCGKCEGNTKPPDKNGSCARPIDLSWFGIHSKGFSSSIRVYYAQGLLGTCCLIYTVKDSQAV